jgi:transcriptional regulator with XRE-family HTH domain
MGPCRHHCLDTIWPVGDRTLRRNRLKRWRVSNGYTLAELSDLTGVSESHLSRLERDLRQASPAMKVRMARTLDVRVCNLFDVPEPVKEQ